MSIIYLICAIFFICIAHLVRVTRWKMFIEVYEKPQSCTLIQSLSFGYFLNYFLPYKLGDLFRAYFSGKTMKNKFSLSCSTIIIERYLDILSVGIIFAIISFFNIYDYIIKDIAYFYFKLSIILFVATVLILAFQSYIKKICYNIARIFNNKIESGILVFVWALIWNFKDIFLKINKIQLIFKTVLMWILYLSSYYSYTIYMKSISKNLATTDVIKILFSQHSIASNNLNIHTDYLTNWGLYLILPLILMVIISLFFGNKSQTDNDKNYLNLLPQLDKNEKLKFLESYFYDDNRQYLENYLKINQNISIIRDYSAGSNATTILCLDSEKMFWRKYTFGSDAQKLNQQILWIEQNQNNLPLPKIINKDINDLYCYYDMEFQENSVSYFEYIHSVPIEKSWEIMTNIFNVLNTKLYSNNTTEADYDTIKNYIENKVVKNLEILKKSNILKQILEYDFVIINGVNYKNLHHYYKYLTFEYLYEIFKSDKYSVIHGDLTTENIICNNNSFYLIDPNPDNIHNSPSLDYGKMLQSIHGGYEFLMNTKEVSAFKNSINFMYLKSSAYNQLHEMMHKYMLENFGYNLTKSIYFHEIIHWLRLLPYKLNKDKNKAIMFYAGLLMVLQDIETEFCK